VHFNTNGHGQQPADAIGVSSIAVADLPVLSTAGYTFLGWSATINGPVTTSNHAPDSDSTLFAQWYANDLIVALDTQGGSAIVDQETVTGETADDPGKPTRAGYTFLGWFTAPTGGEAIEFPYLHGQTSGFVLYAQWKADDLADTGATESSLSLIALGAIGLLGAALAIRRRTTSLFE
jgi:uncharacterized repeat protein (TIGR02543 family)/LPXTG-motif cell wall-anchored protein